MASEAMSAFVRFFVRDDVSGPAEKVRRKVEDLTQEMDEASRTAGKDLVDGLNKVKSGAVKFATGIAAAGAGIAAFAGGALALANGTMEFQEDMGKLQTAFETTGHSVETAQSVYKDFVGLLGETDQSVEAANHLAELTSDTKELSDWGTIAAGVYAKFGDSLPLEGLTEAANHTAKLGEVQGPLADALEWAGRSTDEFNKQLAACNSEEERASLITSTLNDIYGEAGGKYRELNADLIAQREAQSNWTAAMTEAGNAVRPFVTELTNIGAAVVEKVTPYLSKLSDWVQSKIPVMKETVGKLKEPFQWLIDNLPTIVPIVVGIATAFMAYSAISGIVTAVSAVMTILRSRTLLMAAAQGVLNAVMNLNPFVLITTLIVGLVAAFVTAYATSETFRNKVSAVFDSVKSKVSTAVTKIKETISGIVTTVKDVVSKIKSAFSFDWSLPKPKLPSFSVSGGEAPWGFMGKGSLPRVAVEWFADGALFSQPTLFATASGFKGVGEAGTEAVAPLETLLEYVRTAVREEMGRGGGYVANISVTTGETDEMKLAKMITREQRRQAYALGAI